MENPDFERHSFINLQEFLKGSRLLEPYKEEVRQYFGEQFLIAVRLWQDDKLDEALSIFDNVYEFYPNFFIHKFIRLADRIKHEDSEALLAELDTTDYHKFPENLDKFFYKLSRALLYFKQFDIDECINECEQTISINKFFAPVYIMLGDCLLLRYRYKEAIKVYQTALRSNYKTDHSKANLAYAYFRLNKNRRARKLFQSIVDQFPENHKIQYNMALCYLRARKHDLALYYLDRVEKINPDFSGLHLTRGGIYLKQGKMDKAIKSLEKATNLGSANAENLLKNITQKMKIPSSK